MIKYNWKLINYILMFTFLFYRKHTLNCHRMKPSLFSVLCEIKEKTGKLFYYNYFVFILKKVQLKNDNMITAKL